MRRPDRPADPVYSARVLEAPRLTESGVESESTEPVAWPQVAAAVAAEVGEPQGVRTIVFDLLARTARGGCRAWRLDADPGEDAIELARRLAAALGERAGPSIKSLAADGIPTRWFPDLESFEEAVAEEVDP